MCRFLPAPSVRKATHYRRPSESVRFISIHALREEGDPVQPLSWCRSSYFYPRPPRGGRPVRPHRRPDPKPFLSTPSARRATLTDVLSMTVSMIFLSTPSARRATSAKRNINGSTINFYPRPPRGGRPAGCLADLFPAGFLSTPSARRATFPVFVGFFGSLFLSTPSARRATPLPL